MISSVVKRPGSSLPSTQTLQLKRILLVDDDLSLCGLLSEYLGPVGFEVEAVHNGLDALERVFSGDYFATVLDLMLPGMKGLDVLQRIRAKSNIPVLILTAQGDEIDRILGLEVGADDYLPKPFNPRELVARIRAILRRTRTAPQSDPIPEVVRVGDIELDPATRTVRQRGTRIEFTSVEFNLLEVLLREAGRVVAREELVDTVLSRKFSPFDRSIDMHISKVRKKLGDSDNGTGLIKTVRGVGDIFALARDQAPSNAK